MRRGMAWMLAVCLLLAGCAHADAPVLVYESDFSNWTDGWGHHGENTVRSTKEGTLCVENRKNDYDGAMRSFNLAPGTEYRVSVEILQKGKPSADFWISLERVADGRMGWDNLVLGTVKKGEWTTLSGNFVPGEYDSYDLYVETAAGSPNLSFEIRNFRLEAPNGLPAAKEPAKKTAALIADAEFAMLESDGMRMPLLGGEAWAVTNSYNINGFGKRSRYEDTADKWIVENEISVSAVGHFYEDAAEAEKCYASTPVEGRNIEKEAIEIDGHPAVVAIYDKYDGKEFFAHCGILFYVRQNRLLKLQLSSRSDDKKLMYPEEVPAVTLEDMRALAGRVSYDASAAPVREEDLAVQVAAKGEPLMLHPGMNIQFEASFVNPEKARSEGKGNYNYEYFTWSVVDRETGAAVPEVQIEKDAVKIDNRTRGKAKSVSSAKKKITVQNKLNRVVYAEVVAESAVFHTKGVYPIILAPKVKKMALEPKKLTLYAGDEAAAEVKLSMDPAEIPMVGLSWAASRDGIVELAPGENGTAAVKPLAKGNIRVSVAEPGGQKAAVQVNVVDPVEEVKLTVQGKAAPGKTVTVRAELLPKTTGVKDVEWSVSTDEAVASVNARGQVKIAKDVPSGTVITVTCRALGAPELVTASVDITVE